MVSSRNHTGVKGAAMSSMLVKFEAYLLTEKRVAPNTFSAYKRDVYQLQDYMKRENNITLKKVTREHLKKFLQFLKKEGLSARTLSRKISAFKTLFSYLNRYHGWQNVAAELIFPKLEKKLPRYLQEKEVKQLFEIADRDSSSSGIRNKVMLYLMYVSGMRISELVGITVGQIQFDSNFITVRGKGGKDRMIPIPEPVMTMLKEYIETVLQKLMDRGGKRRKGDYLFPVTYAGKIKPISRQAFWAILKNLWKKSGSSKSVSPHQLRHSLATHMLKNGVDLRSLQLILGHENLSTVQIYTHLETSYLRSVYDKKHPRS